jgi:hypothetical protein
MPLVRISRPKVAVAAKEPRPGDSKAHRKFVASLPCCIPDCGARPSDPHHLMGDLKPGMGLKAEDRWCVPLCAAKHHVPGVHAHGNDLVYLMERGMDGKTLATELWRISQKHGAGTVDAEEAAIRLLERMYWKARQMQSAI